jgi:hypothetical protein
MCLQQQSARDAALAELAEVDPASFDPTDLMRQVTDLSVFISRAQAQLARLTGALDACGGAAVAGHRSTAAFIRHGCGTTAGHASELVSVARGLRRAPDTERSLQAGRITFDQAQVIVRTVAAIGDDRTAREAEVALLARAPELDARRAAPAGRRTPLPGRSRHGGGAGTAALNTGSSPDRHASAPHVSILVRDETLAQAAGAPPGRTGHGALLTARQVLAMCCGAQLSAIRWQDGLPLDVGRAARVEPPGLRRALEARDRTCRWRGCDTPGTWCTGHHILGWRNGARTSLGEMVLLCHVHHHYFVHLLGWTISGDPNGTLRFHHPSRLISFESPLPGRIHAP